MNITKLLAARSNDSLGNKNPTIAFLGDSVTQGCFELYKTPERISTVCDQESVYSRYVAKILHMLYPKCNVNIINAGISGDSAPGGYKRIERDVLCHKPDLTVVCFGLNDSAKGPDKIDKYTEALGKIFDALKAAGSEIIFMTPCMMCTGESPLNPEIFREFTAKYMEIQNSGLLDRYIEAGRKNAKEYGVRICDVYAKWKAMHENGVDVTALHSNYINHPTREMHWLFAYSLVEEMMK